MTARVLLDLKRSIIEFSASEESVLDRVAASFSPLVIDGVQARRRRPDFRVTIRKGPVPGALTTGTVIARAHLPEEGYAEMAEDEGRIVLLFPDRGSARMDPAARSATVTFAEGRDEILRSSCLMLPFELALDLGGQSILHAALFGLVEEPGVILLLAPSGTGKTTTSLALHAGGFRLLADDAAILRMAGDDVVTAWGLPRSLHVHRRTAEMLPWVKPLLSDEWSPSDETSLPWRKLLGEDAPVLPPEPVRAIYFLERHGDAAECRTEPMTATEAMVEMIADNVRVGETGLVPVQAHRLDVIDKLAATVPARRLVAGSDLSSIARAIRQDFATPGQAKTG